ncbi:MAG: cytochrome P450 [Planctomycetia bacterium]|nr:cytochrome P450 [Planctomycetia bacterium]
MARAPDPPGPPGHWLLGNLREFRHDMLAFYERMSRDYGDVVAYRLGPRKSVLLTHPDLIEQVLVTENRNFIKHYALRLLRPTLGDGLLLSEGEFWLRQRRLIQPVFNRQRVDSFAAIIVDHTRTMLDSWRPREARDLHAEMMKLALGIVTKALLDVDSGDNSDEVSRAADVILADFNSRFKSAFPPPFWLPHPRNWRLKRQVRRLDALLQRLITQRRSESEDRGDLLSLLMRARDESDNSGMTDRHLRDEIMTVYLAGHETTAHAMAWTWYLLATHPHVEARLLAEIESVVSDRLPTAADVPRLVYAEQVVLESLRLYPPAFVIGREPLHDCTIGGYHVAAGTSILMPQWVVHRDPRFFDRPGQFDPDRWNDGLMKRLPKYAYFPFGGGPRLCIGNSFAMLEAILVLATVLPRFRFELSADVPVVPWPTVTLRPRNGIHAVVHTRSSRVTADNTAQQTA